MQFRGALLAASVLAVPIAASAQPVTGLYVSGGAGVNLMLDQNVGAVTGPSGNEFATNGNLSSRVGPAFQGAVGWGFGDGFRAEVEMGYTENGFDSSGSHSAVSVGGTEQKYGPMVNAYYDFTGLGFPVEPYVGVGVGYQWAKEGNVHVSSGANSANLYGNSVGNFAYQAIVGLAMPIAAAPGLALTAEYRFMGLSGSRSYGSYGTIAGHFGTGNVKLQQDFNNIFLVGFRYNFGQAPPPAPAPVAAPAPAVQPARSYLVFFDWDKATLTDRARQIIHEAAENSTHVQYTRIDVNGYTDTSGTPQYNMGLSIRRAGAVKAELIRDGVPATAITTQGFGETHLLVPTGAGVREPQNRRVEIIIH